VSSTYRAQAQPSDSGQRAALMLAVLGFFVVALDAQIVNVALPEIRTSLGGGLSGLQWVLTGYTLMFASLQLFAGALADRSGSRRVYGVGMTIFVISSAACAAAPNLPALVAARVVQGAGAAMITPASLALIRGAFVDPVARSRAITYWALGGAVATAAGPVVGGAFTQLDWRLIFLINIPVAGVAFAALRRVPPSPRRAVPFDWVGQFSAVVALGGLTYAIIEGADLGYTAPRILAMFGLALAGAGIFVVSQVRGRHPMVPPVLFESPIVPAALLVGAGYMAAFYGMVFVQSLYFQQLRGIEPLATGLLFLPMTVVVAIVNPFIARTMNRYGQIVPVVGGLLVMAAGLLGLALLPSDAPVLAVAMLMVPIGVGGSFTVPAVTAMIMDQIPGALAGTASGVLSTARQLGGALGVAIFGAVLVLQPQFLTGLRANFIGAAAFLLVLIPVIVRAYRAPGQ